MTDLDDEIDEEAVVEEESEAAGPEEAAPEAAPVIAQDEPKNLLTDPYEFDNCTISIQIVLLPADGSELGREVMIGVRNHQDPPIIRVFRESEVALASPVTDLLEELRGELDARKMANAVRMADEAKKKAEQKPATAKAPQAEKPAPKPVEKKPAPVVVKKVAPVKKVGKEPSKEQLSLFG